MPKHSNLLRKQIEELKKDNLFLSRKNKTLEAECKRLSKIEDEFFDLEAKFLKLEIEYSRIIQNYTVV